MLEGNPAQAGDLSSKIAGIWLSVWAIRYQGQLDYKLSSRARLVRWAVVALGFSTASTPGANLGAVRLWGGFVGLCFLCWPNLAYHLTRVFDDWPTTEGTVGSSEEQSTIRWIIRYDFGFDGERYGGTCKVKALPGIALRDAYPSGASIVVRFDPLNPRNSAVSESSASRISGSM